MFNLGNFILGIFGIFGIFTAILIIVLGIKQIEASGVKGKQKIVSELTILFIALYTAFNSISSFILIYN